MILCNVIVGAENLISQDILKVLNELQSSYDELLHKYAAAENALDKVSGRLLFQSNASFMLQEHHLKQVFSFQVRFGAAPPPDCGDREEAFMLADKVLHNNNHQSFPDRHCLQTASLGG